MIKSNLAIFMAKKKINIAKLSNETGIARNTLSNLYHETGKGVQFDTIEKLCLFFNCNVGDLLEIAYEEKESSEFAIPMLQKVSSRE